MLTNEPGWYPDPDGARQVRFWDGDSWTEYVQPFAPVLTREHGTDSALEDYPYLLDADLRRPNEPRVVSTWTPAAVAAPVLRRTSGSAARWWVIGGAAAFVVVVLAVLMALRPEAPPLADPAPSSTVTSSATVTLGAPASVDVPTAGAAVVTLDVPRDGAYFVEATSSADLSAELSRDGVVVWSGDDRRRELAEIVGGEWQDPGAFVQLAAGTYTMTLTERTGLATTAVVTFFESDVVDVTVGGAVTVDVAAGSYAVLRLVLDGEAPLTIDVRSIAGGSDPRLTTFQTGRAITTDDRAPDVAVSTGASEYDPYLEATFPAGTSFLVLDEYGLAAVTLDVTVTAR